MTNAGKRVKQSNRGFTLLEVLVAFAILSLSLLVIFRIYSTGFRGIGTADWKLQAIALAKSKLASVGIDEQLSVGTATGVSDDGFAWELTISAFAASPADKGQNLAAYFVQVSVSNSQNPKGAVRLSTLRLSREK